MFILIYIILSILVLFSRRSIRGCRLTYRNHGNLAGLMCNIVPNALAILGLVDLLHRAVSNVIR